jgi:hypothetical protein
MLLFCIIEITDILSLEDCQFHLLPNVYVSSYNRYFNMTSFKRFGSKSVVKYAYIGISADRQCHDLLWQLYKNKYRICH